MYRVIVRFRDLQDGNRLYNVGDKFPRAGLRVSDKRIKELMSDKNRRGIALIVEDKPKEASPAASLAAGDIDTGVNPPKEPRTKKKPRKKQETC